MTWRDQYRTASLDGKKFRTQSSTITAGRNVAEYHLPFDEDDGGVASVDLGLRAREFKFTAIFLGDDYHVDRDELLAILELPGPYRLEHPYTPWTGLVSIKHGDVSITESTDRGGMCTIEITCRKARDPNNPSPAELSIPTAGGLPSAAADLGTALADAMEAGFTIAGVQDFVADAAIDVLDDVLNDLREINGAIDAVLAIPGNVASQIDNIARELAELINTPRALFDAIDGAMDLIGQAYGRLATATGDNRRAAALLTQGVAGASGMLSSKPAPPDIETEAREQERANRAVLQLGSQAGLLRHLGNAAATSITYDSADDARAMARTLAEAMRGVLESEIAGNELSAAARGALLEYRTQCRRALEDIAGTLPEISEYTPGDALPSCVIAYELYGNAERATEIEQRNRISDPGMIPASTTLEVLVK